MHSITFTLYQQLTKTTSIQKLSQASQRCLKVMQNIKILKIKLGKVINDFEKNVSIEIKKLDEKWKVVASEIF
jgi:hypothetical protein